MNNDKVTVEEIFIARLALDYFEDGKFDEDTEKSIRVAGHDVKLIERLCTRMQKEGKLPEESHRYQAGGEYEKWAKDEETFSEILSEFSVQDGLVDITEDELLDMLAYVAKGYMG